MILKYSNKSSDPFRTEQLFLTGHAWNTQRRFLHLYAEYKTTLWFYKKKEEDNDDGLYVVANVVPMWSQSKRQFPRSLLIILTREQTDWKNSFFLNKLWSVWTLDNVLQ